MNRSGMSQLKNESAALLLIATYTKATTVTQSLSKTWAWHGEKCLVSRRKWYWKPCHPSGAQFKSPWHHSRDRLTSWYYCNIKAARLWGPIVSDLSDNRDVTAQCRDYTEWMMGLLSGGKWWDYIQWVTMWPDEGHDDVTTWSRWCDYKA